MISDNEKCAPIPPSPLNMLDKLSKLNVANALSFQEKMVEIEEKKIDIQDRKVDIDIKRDQWSLCGSQSSGALIRYVGQLGTCLLVLSFCFVQLVREPAENREVYLSIITGIIGYLLPNPSLPHDYSNNH